MEPSTPSSLAEQLASLSPAKKAALEAMLLARGSQRAADQRIPRRPADADPPLSFAEQRLWLLDQLEPNHPFYNMPLAARLVGLLDQAAFARSLQHLLERHESLRYSYHTSAGEPTRKIHDHVTIEPQYVDLRNQAPGAPSLIKALRAEARKPFDLAKPPLLRCVVYEVSDSDRVVLLVMHHIISDGWSMWVMLSELAALYDAAVEQPCLATPLNPLPIQYSDFAHWQRERCDASAVEQQIDYWKRRLADAPTAAGLPTDYPRPAVQDFDGAMLPFELSADLSEQLSAFAEEHGVTPFMVLMAAYQAWLSRYTGTTDLCVGTAVANRTKSELERLIGFFVNTLAFRCDLSDDPTFADLVQQVRETALEAQSSQDVPFDQIIEAVAPDRDQSHDALFQTALVVQNPPREFATGKGLEITPLPVDNGTAKYDLTFFFWQDRDQWQCQAEYRTSLFKQETVRRFIATLQTLLADALRHPTRAVSKLELLDGAQRQALVQFNQTERPLQQPWLIHERIEHWMTCSPDSSAIHDRGQTLSYGDLDQRSAAVASSLIDKGVVPDAPVVVCLPRSVEGIIAMVGIWRAGGVYVPVDAEMATGRLAFVAKDCRARLVIGRPALEPPADCQLVTCEELINASSPPVEPVVTPRSRAYVIYTSGSTGEPKGVECEHRAIVNFVSSQTAVMEVAPDDRVLHALSPSFDGGLSEVLLALANGAACVIAQREEVLDPDRFTKLLNDQRVTMAKFTPALLATLDPAKLPGLQTVLSAGDKLTGELARRWLTGRRFFNGYGPTEATVGLSMYPLPDPPPPGAPPIGAPMGNLRAYVLDGHRQPVPLGVTGEIYIGGAGVARGYLNRAEETAAKFLPDPFTSPRSNGDMPARMYRTGDRGCWRAEGVLEFRGRVDEQVQLRGYRVEPGEVSSALESLPQVDQSYTCVQTDESGNQRLVSYLVPAATTDLAVDNNEHLASWQSLMTQTHQNAGVLRDVEFDITGWVSTFTGKPIPEAEMRQWVDATVGRIQRLQPQDVLEIGCGAGLILLNLAPHCRSYVGTDFLARSLDQLRGVIEGRDEDWTRRVELHQQAAHELGVLAGRKFDTIVMNSVVQYFPSVDYLLTVLRQIVPLLRTGGTLFLGDLRNLHLHEAMAAAVEISRADKGLTRRELLGRVEGRLRHEEEMLLAPELLDALQAEFPRLTDVEVQLKQGPADNELTRYRYDAVLRFDGEPASPLPTETIDAAQGVDAQAILRHVTEQGLSTVLVHDIVNPRVDRDYAAWQTLRDSDEGLIVDTLRANRAPDARPLGIDPDDWHDALRKLPESEEYTLQTRWSRQAPNLYDVLISHTGTSSKLTQESPVADGVDWQSLANQPLEEKRLAKLTPQLRQALSERLPQYMIPSAFVLLSSLPRTVQGKIDRDALPPPSNMRPAWTSGYVEPEDEHQQLVASAWEAVLGVSPIGAEDNFFELGGHSMLAVRVMAEIESRSGVAVPLAALFQEPTVRHLAAMLADPDAAEAASSLIDLNECEATQDLAPLFCIHPAGGTVFCYQGLARHFANKRPVVGVQAVGVDGLRPPHETLEQMVDHYVGLLKSRWPLGPYHLCGWSLGGNIAYGVAARLAAQGDQVGLVALFDSGATPPAESLSEDDLAPLLAALFPDLDHLPLEELRQLDPEAQVEYFTQRATQAGLVDAAQLAASRHVYAVFQKNVEAVHRHRSGTYPGRITLFRAAEQSTTSNLSSDPLLGWGELASQVDTYSIPSDHAQMMATPQVEVLARQVESALATLSHN